MSGNEDLANQMFVWRDESVQQLAGGDSGQQSPILCLRPEMTPSLARLVMQQGKKLIKPLKYFSIAQCWRNEQVTRGRKREHYQWNCDIWGIKEVYAEAELLSLLHHLFAQVNLTNDIVIKVSSRKLLQSILWDLDHSSFVEVCCILDRIAKLELDEIRTQLTHELKLSPNVVDRIFRFVQLDLDKLTVEETLGCIESILNETSNDAPNGNISAQSGLLLFQEASSELLLLFKLAHSYGYDHLLKFDTSIVRGLSYYTGIVFEVFCTTSSLQRAICGGGRYDNLLQTAYDYSENVPAVGFGFGDIVLTEILEEKQLLPKSLEMDDLVIPFDDGMRLNAVSVVEQLRSHNPQRTADLYLGNTKKMKQMFNYADRIGAERVILVAPDEWEIGEVRIKYLREEGRPQYNVPAQEVSTFEQKRHQYKLHEQV
eukprot:CAMPEP_0117442760 /NCGR_PEP_ID=MMETSP0759-20121206/4326_1 /TAXON_ID=63605 /ORGANISM="Percolomonas cosmopolitus, Strain WS" /LENGTH=427 /DNA_ID=CAMNT_0005234675 /DNA_START=99 /DNA_END=1383 /DNA_ORIENTATION=+